MTRQTLGALITLNLALLVALVVTLLTPPTAIAQAHGRGEDGMISGEVAGREAQQVVYLVEVKSMKMAALMYNSANNQVTVLDHRDMSADLTAAGGAR